MLLLFASVPHKSQISLNCLACSRLLERSVKERARGRKRRRRQGDENEGGPHPRRFRPLALSFTLLSRSLEQAMNCLVKLLCQRVDSSKSLQSFFYKNVEKIRTFSLASASAAKSHVLIKKGEYTDYAHV